jgi:TolB-like protein
VERRLAAILAADVAGYSRHMGADEEEALRTLRGHREVFDDILSRHRGRIFHTAGDSVIAEFASPVDAVRAAVAAQEAIAERNATLPVEHRMLFRVGLNLGDVMVQGDDLLGDGVNVAARIEGLAEPGGICLARSVYEPVRAALALAYRPLGERRLKNIAQPVMVYAIGGAAPRRLPRVAVAAAAATIAVIGTGAAWMMMTPRAGPEQTAAPAAVTAPAVTAPAVTTATPTVPASADERRSIAVLPFANHSGDAGQDYFSDGITEDLITDLAKLSGLMVIARSSVSGYRGMNVGLAQVGRELNARYIVEGSVRRAGDRLRITAQLNDASTGHQLWAERYDRELKDIFDLQDEVRQKIVAALALKLSPRESQMMAKRPTNNVEAYDAWARGLKYSTYLTREDNLEARRMFQRAIDLDPGFARAYGWTANTYGLEAEMGWAVSDAEREDAAANAVRYGERAVALDDSLPEARWTLARAYVIRQQTPRAQAELLKAIELNPSYADGHAYYAMLMAYEGRAAEGMTYIQQAMRFNPQYPFWYLTPLGNLQFVLGRYEEAAATFRRLLERNPNWHQGRRLLVATLGYLGRIEDAQWELSEMQATGIDYTIAWERQQRGQQRSPAEMERVIQGLRKAGVPEGQ